MIQLQKETTVVSYNEQAKNLIKNSKLIKYSLNVKSPQICVLYLFYGNNIGMAFHSLKKLLLCFLVSLRDAWQ